jgi:hypothetical protein
MNEKLDIENQTPGAIPAEVDTHAEVSLLQCDESSDGILSAEPTNKLTPKNIGAKLAKATVDQGKHCQNPVYSLSVSTRHILVHDTP